jgi:hypothetical protein
MNISTAITQFKNTERARRLTLATSKAFRPAIQVAHRHGPAILTGAGIVGGIATVVLASRATLKVEPVVDEATVDIALQRERANLVGADMARVVTDEEINYEIRKIKVSSALKIAKLYVPTVSIGVASIGCVLGAYGVMKKRNVALIAAYNALEKSFEVYRKRVVDEYGEEKDRDFRYGLRDEKVQDPETGKNKTITHVDPNGISQYARFFDDASASWSKTPEYNLVFLRAQQNYFNDLLRARGHVFLNEVYDQLGLERSQAGQMVGWVVSKDGDNYIDFGIYDFDNERKREFVNGRERNILLDFNVDGVIVDRI